MPADFWRLNGGVIRAHEIALLLRIQRLSGFGKVQTEWNDGHPQPWRQWQGADLAEYGAWVVRDANERGREYVNYASLSALLVRQSVALPN
jgi:hypothetical protein